ncbi:MAG: DUF4126 domain-containing protein [Acidobacteriota bacterium]
MDLLTAFGRTLGFSLTSGVNLYATVAVLGLAARFDWVSLPPQYDVFASDWVIGCALVLYAVEFIADKIPWVDTAWDSVHTFIRPVGGALVALGTLGEASLGFEVLIGLLGGTVAAGSHFTKASTRVVVNASPEPFSNWVVSLLEDAFVIGLGMLALKFPLAALVVALAVLVVIVMSVRWIVRKLLGPRVAHA